MSSYAPGKLKPEIKSAWVAALRSGEYKQGKKVLKDPCSDQYCCLGVNVELTGGRLFSKVEFETRPRAMPCTDDASEWWETMPRIGGTPYPDSPFIMLDGGVRLLTELNDVDNYTFAQIADLIEEQL